jgi:hypothetical protein
LFTGRNKKADRRIHVALCYSCVYAVAIRLEGVVEKEAESPYRQGARSKKLEKR